MEYPNETLVCWSIRDNGLRKHAAVCFTCSSVCTVIVSYTKWISHNRQRYVMPQPEFFIVVQLNIDALFLYSCPDCTRCPANATQTGQQLGQSGEQ